MKAAVFTETESEQRGHVIAARDRCGGVQERLNLSEVSWEPPLEEATQLRRLRETR